MTSLTGKRVWLTRSEEGNQAWESEVRAAGALPMSLPCLSFHTMPEQAEVAQTILNRCDWAVFSSARGVQAFTELQLELGEGQRIACVGDATASACRASLGRVDLVADGGSAASLATELLAISDWKSAALLGASDPRPELTTLLREAGKEAHACPIYSTVSAQDPLAAITIGAGDAVFLASPSALQALIASCELPASTILISIGPTTSEAIRSAGFEVAAESETRNVQGMLSALAQTNQPAQ